MDEQEAERGASVVEYGLVIALVALVAIGAARFLGGASSDSLQQAGEGVASSGATGDRPGGSGSGGASGGSGGRGGSASTTPTPTTSGGEGTTSTTSTTPSTVTTGADPGPTTTVAPPSSTTPRTEPSTPREAVAGFTDVDTWRTVGASRWEGSAGLRITDEDGESLGGVEVEIRIDGHGIDPETHTVTTDGHGRATLEVGPYRRNGNNRVDEVEATIVGVRGGDGVAWSRQGESVTFRRPG